MAAVYDNRRKALVWYFLHKKMKRQVDFLGYKHNLLRVQCLRSGKRRRLELLQAMLACICYPRNREIWMRPRSFAWFEMVETHFSDDQWYENFRVTKGTFAFLLSKVNQDIYRMDTIMRKAISAKHRLAVTLYFLASTAEYRTIGNLFGVSAAFVCICVKEVCQAIQKRFPNVINLPQGENLLQVIQCYEEKWGFPMCVGAIDGTHIPISAPTESHTDYVNRKGRHSIIMQAVVDCYYLFRDIVVGWPGSVHDARVLSNSGIFKKANANELFLGVQSKQIGDLYIPPLIVGDPAYPLLSWLMKPYPENVNTPRIERVFNYKLSRARMTAENTFGRWKGRFIRFTKKVDMQASSLCTIVAASCILHNICEVQNNEFLPHWELEQAQEEPAVVPINNENARDAVDIRGCLAEYFV